jgi:hypothetical protein
MNLSRRTVSRLIGASALAACLAAPAAKAGGYSCQVPRALLCEGCASQIAIALQPGGACRISFTPASASSAPTPSPSSAAFEFRVETAPIAAPRPRRSWRAPRLALLHPPTNPRCFVFNAHEYCE